MRERELCSLVREEPKGGVAEPIMSRRRQQTVLLGLARHRTPPGYGRGHVVKVW